MPTQKIKREQLLHALELISPGLSTREVVDQSNSYCFNKDQVFTYDDETACIMPSPLKIRGSVPAEPLKNMLSKLKEEYLEFTQEKGALKIKGKGQWATINMENKIELPIENLEIPTKWKKLPDQFSEALRLVGNCAGRDDQHFELTCVHLHKHWMEAYDTYQLARYSIQLGLKTDTLVRQVSVRHLINLEMTEFGETDQWLHFRNSAGLIFALRRFTDNYPDLKTIAQVSGEKINLPKGLADITDRAEVFSIKNDKENHVLIDLKPGWVFVEGQGQHGKYRGRRKIKYTGQPLKFLVHPEILMQLVKNHNECEICIGKIKALKSKLGDFLFVTSLASPTTPPISSNGTVTTIKKKKKVKV